MPGTPAISHGCERPTRAFPCRAVRHRCAASTTTAAQGREVIQISAAAGPPSGSKRDVDVIREEQANSAVP